MTPSALVTSAVEGTALIIFLISILAVAWISLRLRSVFVEKPIILTREQQDISGEWEANAGTQDFRLVIYHKGIYFGVVQDGVSSWPIQFIYKAPVIRFQTSFDGRQFDFEGNVDKNGKRINGTFSEDDEISYWYAKRSDSLVEPLSEQQRAVQLVHSGLDNVLKSLVVATQVNPQSTINQSLASAPPSPQPNSNIFPSTGNTINFDPSSETVAVPVPVLTTTTAPAKRCSKCNAPWDDSFSFCLKCSYSP